MGEMNMSQQEQNKKLIQEGFDLLSDNIEWTITGTCPISKTYTSRKQFLDEAVAPLSARLSKQITPKVGALYADDDTLIALWDGTAVAKDGKP
jgi:ketosteroid isomerase-like protein